MATIYAYSSNSIYCTYSLSISRSGSTITVSASGTIYGNGSSSDTNNSLYAHLRYNVDPANTSGTTTYVSNYGSSFGNGVKIVSAPLNKSSIPTSGKTFSASWTITNNAAVTYNNCALFLSKSSTDVSSLGGTAYAFIGKKDSSLSVNKLRYYTQSLSIGAGYTACTAPTAVSSSATILSQGQNVTISWSGASGGSNNGISGYKVYWKAGSAPTTSSYDGTKSSTTTSTTVPMPGNKGDTYYFKVQTIGSVSGYNSGISSKYATCKVNQLPNAPTVTPSTTIVPSTGGSVTFTLSATDPDGQTVSYAYATSETGDKTAIASGGSINVNADNKTFYFFSKDSLEEYSSYTKKTITVNTEPATISFTTTGAGTLYESKLLEDSNFKNFRAEIQVDRTSNIEIDDKVKWFLRYQTIPSGNTLGDWTGTLALGENQNQSFTFNLSENSNFNKLDNIAYQIGASRYDGIENSEITWHTNTYVIAPKPEIGVFCNQHGSTNVPYSKENNFYEKASITATIDTSVTSVTFSIDKNAEVLVTDDYINDYKTYGYFKINITKTSPNTNYKLEVTINRVTGGSSESKTFNITTTGLPQGANGNFSSQDITDQTGSVKPYTDDGNISIQLYNFFQTLNYANTSNNYNGNSNPKNCISFAFVKGDKTLAFGPDYSNESSSDSLFFTHPAGFYKQKLLSRENPLDLDLEDGNSIDLKIGLTDVFGQTYYITKSNYLTLDFREPFLDGSVLTINPTAETGDTIIKEKDNLTFNFSWKSYNSETANIYSYIYRSNTAISNLEGIEGWQAYPSNNYWTVTTGSATPLETTLIRDGTCTKSIEVSQISESKYLYFKIDTVINGQAKTFYYNGYKISQRQVPASGLKFNSFTYTAPTDTESGKIQFVHDIYNSGGGQTPDDDFDNYKGLESVKIGIQYSTDFSSETSIKKYLNNGVGSDEFVGLINKTAPADISNEQNNNITNYSYNFNDESWSYYYFRLVVQTTIGSTTKTSYGEQFIVYNISPTVSYRKNHLGINVKPETSLTQDGIVYLQSTSNRNKIYMVSAQNTMFINLDDGSIDGAIIDCGSWDPIVRSMPLRVRTLSTTNGTEPENIEYEEFYVSTRNSSSNSDALDILVNEVSTVKSTLNSHISNYNNPHNVTDEQVLQDSDLLTNFNSHITNYNNPHQVSRQQVGAKDIQVITEILNSWILNETSDFYIHTSTNSELIGEKDIIVSPASGYTEQWTDCGIYAEQTTSGLVFYSRKLPTGSLVAEIMIIGD